MKAGRHQNGLYNLKQVESGKLNIRKSIGSLPPMKEKGQYMTNPYDDGARDVSAMRLS